MTEIKLKPCPFCGEIPKYYQYRNEWCVECHSDKCWVFPETDLCSSKEEATEKWNARTPIADVVEVIRCKDCEFNVANKEKDPLDITDYSGEDIVCSYFLTDGLDPNDYCSRGTRKSKERGGEK